MTWGEFKKWVEEKGVTDNMEIDYIDCNENPQSVDMEAEKKAFCIL